MALISIPGYSTGSVGTGTISTVLGTFAEGNTLTFSGSGFGTHPGIIAWDNFNDGIVGTTVNGRSTVDGEVSAWTFQGGATAADVEISNIHQRASTNNARTRWLSSLSTPTISAFGFAGLNPGFREFYCSFYRYMTGTFVPADDNHKQYYMFGDMGGIEYPQVISFIPAGSSVWHIGNNQGWPVAWARKNLVNTKGYNYLNTVDMWNRWETRCVAESDSTIPNDQDGDGIVKHWIDGDLCIDVDIFKFGDTDEDGFTWPDWRLGHMAQGMVDDAICWFDEVYISRTSKRIEISANSTFTEATNMTRSIQPHTSWSDTSITVACNQSDLPTSGSLYAYQLDENDSVVGQIQVR